MNEQDFILICKRNVKGKIKSSLQDKTLNVSKYNNRALYSLVRNDNIEDVKTLLKHKKFKNSDGIKNIVYYTVKHHLNDMFDILFYKFKEIYFNAGYDSQTLLKYAFQYDNIHVVKTFNKCCLLKRVVRIDRLLTWCSDANSVEVYKYVFNQIKLDVQYRMDHLRYFIDKKTTEIVEFLLSKKLNFKYVDDTLFALLVDYSIKFNNLELLKLLVAQEHKFDYYYHYRGYIYTYISQYRFLVQDKKYNEIFKYITTTTLSNRLSYLDFYKYAVHYNNVEIAKFLIKNVFDFRMQTEILKIAIAENCYEIIDYLLSNITNIDNVNTLITAAAKNITTFLYILNKENILEKITDLKYSKIPTPLKTYLAGKFDVTTEEEFENIINFI